MSATWKTRWGSRRVRQDPPTLAEALAAAQGLTDDLDQQIEIAATLMGVDPAEARTEAKKLTSDRRATLTVITPARDKGLRTVVVERRTSRRMAPRDSASRDLQPRDVSVRDLASQGSKAGLHAR